MRIKRRVILRPDRRVDPDMGKFKTAFVSQLKEEQQRQREQKKLHRKHHLQDETIVIVEKSNLMKFIISSLCRLIRLTAVIVIFVLATLGGIALLYPNVRNPLLDVLLEILRELQALVGW